MDCDMQEKHGAREKAIAWQRYATKPRDSTIRDGSGREKGRGVYIRVGE